MIVTCYFNINSKHCKKDYLKWLKSLTLIYDDICMFTDSMTKEDISSLNLNLNFKHLILMELHQLPFYKDIAHYENQAKTDHNKSHSALLYLIYNSKAFFVEYAIKHLEFNLNETLYWMDAGILRQDIKNLNLNLNLTLNKTDKIDILSLYPFTEEDYKVKKYAYGQVRISAGCFGGSIKAWENYLIRWYETYDLYLKENEFIGHEQRIMGTVCMKYPEVVNLIQCKTYDYITTDNQVKQGNPWFYMLKHLSLNSTESFMLEDEVKVNFNVKTKCEIEHDDSKETTVIITTYNRYDMLLEAIKSVKDQTYENYELIVVDDCSTDERYQNLSNNLDIDVLIKADKNSKDVIGHPSPGRQRNIGMKHAKGKYVAFLDDDDVWMPNKLQVQISAMKCNNSKWSCTNGFKYFPDSLTSEPFFPDTFSEFKDNKDYIKALITLFNNILPSKITRVHLECINLIIASSVIISKDLIDEIGYFRNLAFTEDYDYWLSVSIYESCLYINDKLIIYNVSQGTYERDNWPWKYQIANINRKLNNSTFSVFPDEICFA